MKKIIFIFILFLCCGCNVTTSLVGDITTYNFNGEVMKKWENVVIEENVNGTTTSSSFKTFGLNFYDKKNNKYIVLGNTVPYIIEYNVKTPINSNITKTSYNTIQERFALRQKYIDRYKTLAEKRKELKIQLKNAQKNTFEYEQLKNAYFKVRKEMRHISNVLESEFFYTVWRL